MEYSIENKKKFLAEHFKYEVEMAFYLSFVLINKVYEDVNINSAILESSLFHVRNLIEFFYFKKNNKYILDARASDFFDEELRWEEIGPELVEIIEYVNKRIGKEMAHLSFKRLEGKFEDKLWMPSLHMKTIHEVVLLFLEKLPSKYFSQQLNELVNFLKKIKFS